MALNRLPGSGERDRLIEIRKSTVVGKNAVGEEIREWLPFVKEWARVEQVAGNERFFGQQFLAEVDTAFAIPYVAGISPRPELRIELEGRVYDLHKVDEIGRRGGLEILARARAE